MDGLYNSVAGGFFNWTNPVPCRDTDPCRGLRLCRLNTNGSSGTFRAYVSSRWLPTWNWDVRMAVRDPQGLAIDSNALTATVARPQPPPGLPVGDRAALIQFTASRTSANVGSFLIAVYSPGVSGRRLSLSLFIRSRGQSIPGFPDKTSQSEERLVDPVAGVSLAVRICQTLLSMPSPNSRSWTAPAPSSSRTARRSRCPDRDNHE